VPLKTIGKSAKFGRLLCNSQYVSCCESNATNVLDDNDSVALLVLNVLRKVLNVLR
jgi:hypothetical protein